MRRSYVRQCVHVYVDLHAGPVLLRAYSVDAGNTKSSGIGSASRYLRPWLKSSSSSLHPVDPSPSSTAPHDTITSVSSESMAAACNRVKADGGAALALPCSRDFLRFRPASGSPKSRRLAGRPRPCPPAASLASRQLTHVLSRPLRMHRRQGFCVSHPSLLLRQCTHTSQEGVTGRCLRAGEGAAGAGPRHWLSGTRMAASAVVGLPQASGTCGCRERETLATVVLSECSAVSRKEGGKDGADDDASGSDLASSVLASTRNNAARPSTLLDFLRFLLPGPCPPAASLASRQLTHVLSRPPRMHRRQGFCVSHPSLLLRQCTHTSQEGVTGRCFRAKGDAAGAGPRHWLSGTGMAASACISCGSGHSAKQQGWSSCRDDELRRAMRCSAHAGLSFGQHTEIMNFQSHPHSFLRPIVPVLQTHKTSIAASTSGVVPTCDRGTLSSGFSMRPLPYLPPVTGTKGTCRFGYVPERSLKGIHTGNKPLPSLCLLVLQCLVLCTQWVPVYLCQSPCP